MIHALIQMNYILGKKLSNVMYVRGLCMIELIWASLFCIHLRISLPHLDLQVAFVESLVLLVKYCSSSVPLAFVSKFAS